MDRTEQAEFVITLMSSVENSILAKIENGIVPAEWDGLELRRYLAHCFKRQIIGSFSRQRALTYNNDLIVRDL